MTTIRECKMEESLKEFLDKHFSKGDLKTLLDRPIDSKSYVEVVFQNKYKLVVGLSQVTNNVKLFSTTIPRSIR